MSKPYSREEQFEILKSSSIYIKDGEPYSIDFVPETMEEALAGEPILLTKDDLGIPESLLFEEVDLNQDDVITYRLVQSNP